VAMARKYCDRIIALRAGELVFDGPPQALDDARLKNLYGASSEELLSDELEQEPPAMPLKQFPMAA
jgi:phosphonate transport system ATP-binding protein